ncbi:MAG: hypothetical protein KGH98_01470 [Candidatus Micrarchaeota archaeon]|nr:hypothetical protein [Candidatus Micrarchaeota archaeon]
MVKITYAPISELVIHETVRIDVDDLIRSRLTPAGVMPLYWCNGILFSFASVPMNDDLTEDYLKGVIHWMEVHYTEKKSYEEVMELNDEAFSPKLKVRVIDTSASALHNDFVKWLKTRKEK